MGPLQGLPDPRLPGIGQGVPGNLHLPPGLAMVLVGQQPVLEGPAFLGRDLALFQPYIPLGRLGQGLFAGAGATGAGLHGPAESAAESPSPKAWWQWSRPWAMYFLTMLTLTRSSAAISLWDRPSRR